MDEIKLLLQYIKRYYKKLGLYQEEILDIKKINTGKRNNCYTIKTERKTLFCKVFNKKLRYASQFNQTRYYIETNSLKYLYSKKCSVPKVILTDDRMEMMFSEYIPGKTLKQKIRENPTQEPLLIKRTLEEISKIHALVPESNDFPEVKFKDIRTKDYYNSILNTVYLLYKFLGLENKILTKEDIKMLEQIAENLSTQKIKYGHFELHNDNIVTYNKKVYFVDFEKFHPHIPHLDLISLIMNENINKKNIQNYINYYMELNNLYNKDEFLYTLDCANLYYNLKIVNMIIRNTLGYETRWEEVNGKRIKKLEITNSKFGTNWNNERNENIEDRVKNIINFNFSNNSSINETKNSLLRELLNK